MNNLLREHRTVGIVGLAKNTGKTTTLNALIQTYKHKTIGLTSIGLDGEKIDQMTYLPKPRIEVSASMVVATATQCLRDCSLAYTLLEETPFQTALGPIVLVKIEESGHLVIAGPTTNQAMNHVINRLKTYTDHVFIDGAFNRLTFASIESIDAIILATGASVHLDMDETIKKTLNAVNTFSLPLREMPQLTPLEKMVVYHEKIPTTFDRKDYTHLIKLYQTNPFTALYVKGAITETLCNHFIRHQMKNFTLIAQDATKFLLPVRYSDYLKSLAIKKAVLRNINLLAVTINPESPTGKHYDAELFKHALAKKLDVPVINVKRTE